MVRKKKQQLPFPELKSLQNKMWQVSTTPRRSVMLDFDSAAADHHERRT